MFSKEKRQLAKLRSSAVGQRTHAAGDPATPTSVLDALASDASIDVRSAGNAASNPSTDPYKLDELAGDTAVNVRSAVASNLRTRDVTRYTLGHDAEKSVREAALTRLLDAHGFDSTTAAIQNSDSSPLLLAVIAEDLSGYSTELAALCGTLPVWRTKDIGLEPDRSARGRPSVRSRCTIGGSQCSATTPTILGCSPPTGSPRCDSR